MFHGRSVWLGPGEAGAAKTAIAATPPLASRSTCHPNAPIIHHASTDGIPRFHTGKLSQGV